MGEDGSYGHPTDRTLSFLRDADVQLYRTDLQGTVKASSDGKTVTFTTERAATAEQINPTLKNAPASYIGNINSGVFHSDTCASLPQEQNQITFDSYEAAACAGYRPHKTCLP